MTKAIAVIPARGGSKRVPKKNVMDFMGKPMIAWTIEAALRSSVFSRVLASTDDKGIAEVAKQYGAEVPFLREGNSNDFTPVGEATVGAVKQAEDHWSEEYDVVVQLLSNCPIRNADDISVSYKQFCKSSPSFQISCFKFGWMNPWWATKLNCDYVPEFLFPEALKKRSQDLDDLYCPTGAIWIADKQALVDNKTFYGPGHIFYPIDWKSAVDIDDYEDLDFAKAVFLLNESER